MIVENGKTKYLLEFHPHGLIVSFKRKTFRWSRLLPPHITLRGLKKKSRSHLRKNNTFFFLLKVFRWLLSPQILYDVVSAFKIVYDQLMCNWAFVIIGSTVKIFTLTEDSVAVSPVSFRYYICDTPTQWTNKTREMLYTLLLRPVYSYYQSVHLNIV